MASDSPLEHLASAVPEVYDQILDRLTPTAKSFLAASSPVCRAAHKHRRPPHQRLPAFRTADLLCSLGTVRWAQARGWSPETTLRPMRASTRPGGPVAHVIGAIGAPVEVVRAFRPATETFGFDKTCVCAAAAYGHASVLAYLLFQHERKLFKEESFGVETELSTNSAVDDSFHVSVADVSHPPKPALDEEDPARRGERDFVFSHQQKLDLLVAAFDRAARADQVEVLDWLWRACFFSKRARCESSKRFERFFLRRIAGAAAEGGALGALRRCEFLLTEYCRGPRRLRDVLTASEQRNDCAIAAFGGHLDALKWMHHSGYGVNEWTCTRAAEGGHLETLKWARENGCPWDCNVLRRAEARGHDRVAAWARNNGCPAEASFPLRHFVVDDE